MPVIFHPAAEEELHDSARFYESRARGLGSDFVAAVERATAQIVQHPEATAPIFAGIRRRLVTGFPFALLYRVVGSEIRILAVMHLRRRPGYWRARKWPTNQ